MGEAHPNPLARREELMPHLSLGKGSCQPLSEHVGPFCISVQPFAPWTMQTLDVRCVAADALITVSYGNLCEMTLAILTTAPLATSIETALKDSSNFNACLQSRSEEEC